MNPKDEERARRPHEELITIDFHMHTTIYPENMQDLELLSRSGRPPQAFEGIKRSGLTACLNGFGGSMARRSSPVPWQFPDLIWDLGIRYADNYHHPETVMRAYSVKDILEAKKNGRTAILSHLENPQMIDNDTGPVDMTRALVARGYSDEAIKKIIGESVLRLLGQTVG